VQIFCLSVLVSLFCFSVAFCVFVLAYKYDLIHSSIAVSHFPKNQVSASIKDHIFDYAQTRQRLHISIFEVITIKKKLCKIKYTQNTQ